MEIKETKELEQGFLYIAVCLGKKVLLEESTGMDLGYKGV